MPTNFATDFAPASATSLAHPALEAASCGVSSQEAFVEGQKFAVVEENEPSANDDCGACPRLSLSLNQSVADFMLRFFGVASNDF